MKAHKFKGAEYINPTAWFVDESGTIKDGLYGGDYIHFTSQGYKLAAAKLAEMIRND